jgi:asparagine synthase (glutamine-hydrolysing)
MRTDPLRTFSVTYPGTRHDEDHFIQDFLRFRENLEPHVSTPDGRDVVDVMQRTVWHHDEPTWGPAVYSWWHVMQCAQQGNVTVILNGQGADELLAGYPVYQPTFLRQLLVTGRLGAFARETKLYAQKNDLSVASVLRLLAVPFWPERVRRLSRLTGAARSFDDSFLHPEFRREAAGNDTSEDRKGFCRLSRHLTSDFCRTRLPELLHAEDRFSMAFSLESRVPFLDYRLVDFVTSLPDDQKLAGSVTKVVLRNAMADKLPASIVNRWDKMGYPTPGNEWLASVGREAVLDLLSSRAIEEHGIFDTQWLRQRFDRVARGELQLRELWRWVSVEVWMRQFFDQSHVNLPASQPRHPTGARKAAPASVVTLGVETTTSPTLAPRAS